MATIPRESNVYRPKASGYGAALKWGTGQDENMYLPLAVSPTRPIGRTSMSLERPIGSGLEQQPEDVRPESGVVYARSDLTGGEGLDFAHGLDPTPLDPTRFWDSEGILIEPAQPGAGYRTKLARATEMVPGSDSTNTNKFFVRGPEARLYIANGSSVWTTRYPRQRPDVDCRGSVCCGDRRGGYRTWYAWQSPLCRVGGAGYPSAAVRYRHLGTLV